MSDSSVSQQPPLPLWPAEAPGALGASANDIPTLTPFLPAREKASGAAILVCPGGGYGVLADHEGAGYAQWLSQNGVAAFVLRYRLGSEGYRHPAMLNDASRAMRLVRTRAGEFNIDATRIGVIGSSAGGHLASTLLVHFDAGDAASSDLVERASSRPDLGILCYPVITLEDPWTHQGSRTNLLGEAPDPALVRMLSAEKQIQPQTPPCFLWHTYEDGVVPVENALLFAGALREKNIPFELHIYEKGDHGMGLGAPSHRWASDCLAWLKERGFLRP